MIIGWCKKEGCEDAVLSDNIRNYCQRHWKTFLRQLNKRKKELKLEGLKNV